MKYFIITVDTEADWFGFRENNIKSIQGIHFLQEACENYNMKPTYLVTYEIATKEESISIIKEYLDKTNAKLVIISTSGVPHLL